MIRRPPRSTLFPYTRSSDLVERLVAGHPLIEPVRLDEIEERLHRRAALVDEWTQRAYDGQPSRAARQRSHVRVDRVEQHQPIAGSLVADVVDEPRVRVRAPELVARRTRQDAQRYREVLGARL